MILWTPMQLELVLEGLEDMGAPCYSRVSHRGVPMLVEKTADGRVRVARLLSTNPAHYLNNDYVPGSFLQFEQMPL